VLGESGNGGVPENVGGTGEKGRLNVNKEEELAGFFFS